MKIFGFFWRNKGSGNAAPLGKRGDAGFHITDLAEGVSVSLAIVCLLLGLMVTGFGQEGKPAALRVSSSAFSEGSPIPAKYTCDGEDISPPIKWDGAPPGTKSLALICDDPDAPAGTWVHWVLYNLPPNSTSLSENTPILETLPNGAAQGRNSFEKIGYGGPVPPGVKPHH